jgi:putative SOS response-associated peptidase YedK
MCYYNGQKVTHSEFIRLKQLEKLVAKYDFLNKPISIGFDYSDNAVLKPIAGKEDFEIVKMEWGFIPHYIGNRQDLNHFRKGGFNQKTNKYDPPFITLNAIGEELFDKTTYKKSAMEKRCLVLSTGFYESRHIFPPNKRTGQPVKTPVKYPYRITVKDKEYFFLAGIWTPWTDKITGEYVESFSVVTTKANSLMEQVHNSKKRMPTILDDDLAYEWIFGKLDQKRITELATYQFPAEKMEAYTIAKDFKDSINSLQKVDYKDIPPVVLQ